MKSIDFCYWLQGYFEVAGVEGQAVLMTEKQVKMIQKHLSLVFKHEIDPSMGPREHQEQLSNLHSGIVTTEEQAIQRWGPRPSPKHQFNMHGWYDPAYGTPKC
jgi:hypothetical protein